MIPETYVYGLIQYLVFLFSTTCHEAAHAWAGWKLGDSTAHAGGQVSLDPRPHIRREPIGMVVFPLLSLVSGGYALGFASTPYDPRWAFKYPRRSAAMSIAGPLANFLLSFLAALAYGAIKDHQSDVPALDALGTILWVIFRLNLVLGLFNLLPLPPMDGSGALGLILSEAGARKAEAFFRQPLVRFLGFFAAWKFFWVLAGPLVATISSWVS